jgi:hypothetical protein
LEKPNKCNYASEKLPWAVTPAQHKFEKFPALEEYKGLMEKYTNWTIDHI